MRSMRKIGLLSAMVGGVLLAGSASADVFQFDPDGDGLNSFAVGSIDLQPGNVYIVTTSLLGGNQREETLYMQTRVDALLGADARPLTVPGLNSDYELTLTATVDLVTNVVPPAVSLFDQRPGRMTLTLWYDDQTDSDDLAGTGFDNGTPIYASEIDFLAGVLRNVPTGQAAGLLDKFGPNDYPDALTRNFTGGFQTTAVSTLVDRDFFLTNVVADALRSDLQAPFEAVNPSAEVQGVTVDWLNTRPSERINGGFETLLQADGTLSFLIPEPTAGMLLGLGGLVMLRRRR